MAAPAPAIFDTDKRVRLGIWGLGRGASFARTCAQLNVDVVAGCDFDDQTREHFAAAYPDAMVTADDSEFLSADFDAVLLATYCPNHADDAIRCLEAGKHVLSEVTGFHTLAEGARLVDAVEHSGLIYQLAENYPFSPANRYLTRRWSEGLFGELVYAEFEYVHNCRPLQYGWGLGRPVHPGWSVHNWRSWISYHYYCTHSLGPMMVITGQRPTRVVALPGRHKLAGYIHGHREGGIGGICPSLINMSNGAVVRNLVGATTGDVHHHRLWGTLGSAETDGHTHLKLRLGGDGLSPQHVVTPTADNLGELAARTGHGGGDFWMIYYFAREILTGEPGSFDIYTAADVTIPGILAVRSASEGGKPYDVPDLRDPAQRNSVRDEHWSYDKYDVDCGPFGDDSGNPLTEQFSLTATEMCGLAPLVRAVIDWRKVATDLTEPAEFTQTLRNALDAKDKITRVYPLAREIADTYPTTDAARVLNELLELGCETEVNTKGFWTSLETELAD